MVSLILYACLFAVLWNQSWIWWNCWTIRRQRWHFRASWRLLQLKFVASYIMLKTVCSLCIHIRYCFCFCPWVWKLCSTVRNICIIIVNVFPHDCKVKVWFISCFHVDYLLFNTFTNKGILKKQNCLNLKCPDNFFALTLPWYWDSWLL